MCFLIGGNPGNSLKSATFEQKIAKLRKKKAKSSILFQEFLFFSPPISSTFFNDRPRKELIKVRFFSFSGCENGLWKRVRPVERKEKE